jgi:hypothetical protein
MFKLNLLTLKVAIVVLVVMYLWNQRGDFSGQQTLLLLLFRLLELRVFLPPVAVVVVVLQFVMQGEMVAHQFNHLK